MWEKYLYLFLDLGSISIPFLYSFEKKLKFIRHWRAVFAAIAIIGFIFIVWDVIFTQNGVWGFNERYYSGLVIFSLPIEEWMFFICIPYACVFTHYALIHFLPNVRVSEKSLAWVAFPLMGLCILLMILFHSKAYTFTVSLFAFISLMVAYWKNKEMLGYFFFSFVILLIPFIMVNGVLTGSLIESEVVWYNNAENLGVRFFTIPVEDSLYALSMILGNLILIEAFTNKGVTGSTTS